MIIHITGTAMWRYERLPHDLYPVINEDVRRWCDREFGKNRVIPVIREIRLLKEGMYHNAYQVFLKFPDHASAIHFRLLWGGEPREEVPANRSTVTELF
jgi:hypothetical protein